MTGCLGACPLEAAQQDSRSVGVVEDAEIILRAAYDPLHFKKGKLQSSIVRAGDLFAGKLSVWRVSEKAEFTLADGVATCRSKAPAGQAVAEVRGLVVKEVRDARRPEIKGRLFCVVDETDTDTSGGSHPAHAHIRVCASLMKGIEDREDAAFQIAKTHLGFLLRRSTTKLYPV